jgi:NADPH-dependent glutamate synthase beta subunit-like oxidoreductase
MPARRDEIEEALSEGVKIVCHCQPADVQVGNGGLEKVVVQKTRPSKIDDSGRRKPELVPDSFFDLEAEMILMAIGEDPGATDVLTEAGVEVQRDGTINLESDHGKTSRPAVFAAGDAAGAPRTVLNAIASGKRAAYGIDVYLARGEREVTPLDFLKPLEEEAKPAAAAAMGISYQEIEHAAPGGTFIAIEKKCGDRPQDFEQTLPPIDQKTAQELASRCLLCGACGECSACLDLFGCPAMHVEDGKVAIDEVLCTGCGVCAIFCPNHAIYADKIK